MGLFRVIFFIVKLGPKEVLKRIEYFFTDHLTGLSNRRAIMTLREGFSVIFIDLDDFKEINDSFGYNAGDEILKRFSEILKGLSRSDDIFIRWGGDEFVLILPTTTQKQAKKLVLRIKEEVKRNEDFVRFSYGIKKEESKEKDLVLLIEKVSKEMQNQKTKKKNGKN
jgi:diguanylate cyclase (GGDEF)-like protein